MFARRAFALVLTSWALADHVSSAAIPASERSALLAVYDATGGSNWTDNGGWRSAPGTECDWRGVRCDDARTTVTLLYLRSNNLAGRIPDELKSLTNLKELYLGDNQLGTLPASLGDVKSLELLDLAYANLTGTIPDSLGGLPNLAELRLQGNALTGNLPVSIGGLSKLTILDLGGNQLSGTIPGAALARLTSLKELYLPDNRFTGGIPTELGSMTSLETLWVYGMPLGGEIPASLGSLKNLKDLNFYGMELTGKIPDQLGNLGSLVRLYLANNRLSGPIPASLGNLTSATEIYLYSNQLSGQMPGDLGRLAAIQNLDLGANQLTGAIPAQLGNAKTLIRLSLGQNGLTGTIPSTLGSLDKLTFLNLGTNALEGALPSSFSGLTSLLEIYLDNNKLTDVNLTGISKLAKLEVLYTHVNPLTQPVDLTPLTALKSLRSLNMAADGLTGPIPAAITSLTSLRDLNLSANQLTGTIPSLTSLTNLVGLGLEDNALTGFIPTDIGRLSKLEGITLARNQLSGAIPREIGQLSSLRYLDFRDNALTGSIPSEIGDLSSLTELRLERNQLSGSIPGEIGKLSQLYVLSLNDNLLSGGFPSIGGLAMLRYVDLSNNQIGGPIPPDIGDASSLDTLFLTGNRLTALPPEVGKLKKLVYLIADGNLLSGSIPKELGDLPELDQLFLEGNQLNGSIPAELGKLGKLERLRLSFNQLTGSIPSSVSGMSSLIELSLDSNQLTGSIPASLGQLRKVDYVNLNRNALTGPIPGELGDVGPSLVQVYLAGNKLTGAVPSTLTKLTGLAGGYGLDLRYNALKTDDAALREFINSKGCCFDITQTLPPNDVKAPVTSTASVTIRWTRILYDQDAGAYEVLVTPPGGTPTVGATTSTKQVSAATVAGLRPGTAYTFQVRTVTQPHDNNPNVVVSEPSAPIGASTAAAGSIAVTLSPSALRMVPGTNVNMTATISPAAATPLDVALTSSNTTIATVPASVTIPAGATTGTFAISGQRIGTTIVTATLPASAGGSSAAADVTVADSVCVRPNTPGFITSNGGNVAVRAGNAVTLSWTNTLASDPLGSYQVDSFTNNDCSTGLKQYRAAKPTLSVSTTASQAGTLCFVVRAFSSTNCPSGDSSPLRVTVQPGPAAFVVAQSTLLSAATSLGVAPPDATIAFRNIGSTSAALTIRGALAFATVSPASFPTVAPGGTATVTLKFDPLATVGKSLQLGSVCGAWNDGTSVEKTVCAAAALTVFEAPIAPGGTAARPQFVSSSEVHFIAPKGSTPPTQIVTVKNPSAQPIRIAPAIGPGGAWLKIDGLPLAPIAPGGSVALTLSVDRAKRATAEGTPPVSTQLIVTNVDGPDGDRAILQVFDEEPPAAQNGSSRSFLGADDYSLVLGSSVYAQGSGGTIFVSDGWIRNKAPNAVNADIYYTPSGTDGIGNPQVKRATVTLQGYATYRLSDFVRGLFETSGSGSVEIRSTAIADLSVRTTVDSLTVKGDSLVRFGAEIPTVQSREGVGVGKLGGASLLLPGIRGGDAVSRTNVILTETSGRAAAVALRLFDSEGNLLREGNVNVLPYSQIQINAGNPLIFPEGSIDGASLEVKPVSGAGTVAAFATVIDNASSGYTTRSGRFIAQAFLAATPKELTRLGMRTPLALPTRLAVATAAHAAGRNESFFTTALSITNGVGSSANLTLKYVVNGQTVASKAVVVRPRATVNYRDVIATLFGITDGTAGMLFVEGDVAKVVVTSDTSTALSLTQPALGISPSTLSAYAPESAFALGDPQGGPPSPVISHPALEESARFRTNLILAEVQGAPVTVRVRVFPPGSGGVPIAETDFTLGAFEKLQKNNFMADMAGPGLYIDYETTVEWVSGTGRVLAVATKIDNDAGSKRNDVYVLGPTGGLQGTIGF